MANRYTLSEFIEKATLKHKNIYGYDEVIYINNKTKIIIFCKTCGNKFLQQPIWHLRGQGCPKCKNKRISKSKTKNSIDFFNEAKIVHNNNYEYLSDYISTIYKIKIRCKICNNIFMQEAGSHLSGNGCKKCAIKKQADNVRLSSEEIESRANKVHNYSYIYFQDYQSLRHKIKIQCKKCSHIFFAKAGQHIFLKEGCPKCNYSKGEKEIEKFLIQNNIEYEPQKKFEKCKYKRCLFFDFYLPKYNICIEFDGIQHFEQTAWFNSNLEITKLKDKIKNDFCKDNQIKLIRISYKEIKNIDKILKLELLSISII